MKSKNNGWISVKDKLPEINNEGKSEEVLCYGKEESHIEDNYFFSADMYKDDFGYIFYNINGEECFKVTHWQPLPKPPNE